MQSQRQKTPLSSVSQKTIGRLSLYRRLLHDLLLENKKNVYSHQLAILAGGTAAQVRRDMMALGYTGSPSKGYDVEKLIESIGIFLDTPEGQKAALVGVGNLGRAILAFFSGRRPKLSIAAAFDSDTNKTGRLIHGCPCFPIHDLKKIISERGIELGIIAVPAGDAQSVADLMIEAGIRGILNFAPVPLHVSHKVHVEYIDMTMALEKVAYFARQGL